MGPDMIDVDPALSMPRRLAASIGGLVESGGDGHVDFTQPAGEPALLPPDSMAWVVHKNPVSTFIGGVAAVLLELAEPRVRTGVWEHTTFRSDPVSRMRRTGLAAMVTVYGPRSRAEAMIQNVRRMHAHVAGKTPQGVPYHANDPVLLDWVQATASYGFIEAYGAYVRPVGAADADRFYGEAASAGRLYGAMGAPASRAALEAQFAAMRPHLEASTIVAEFLEIVGDAPILLRPLRRLQRAFVRASVEILPAWVRDSLALDESWRLAASEARLVRLVAQTAERVALPSSPAVQTCRRLGLPANYLYTGR